MEPRKVNWINVIIVLWSSAFGIIMGFIDRAVNHIGPLESLITWVNQWGTTSPVAQEAWYNTSVTLSSSANSGFSLLGMTIIIVVGVFIMVTIMFSCRCAA